LYIVIIGCGATGSILANELTAEGYDVVVVDKNSSAFENLGPVFNGQTIIGNGIDQDVLKKAGIEQADAFAAVTDNDNVNIMAVQVAKSFFGVPRAVALRNNPRSKSVFSDLGIESLCPAELGIVAIKSILLSDEFHIRTVLGAGEVVMIEIAPHSLPIGSILNQLEIDAKIRINSVIRDGKVKIFEPTMKYEKGDILNLLVRIDSMDTLKDLLNEWDQQS